MRREIYKLTKLKDLTSLKFGKLTAVKIDRDKKKRVYWICKCECGKNKSVASCHLTMGRITHCGCIKRVAHNFVNLEGKTFGNLKVLKISKDNQKNSKDNPVRYLCKCKCGNECVVRGSDLRNGCAISCGCLRESIIAYDLKKYSEKKYESINEYKILKSKKTGKYLPFDIYIPSIKLFVEINGQQHYYISGWTKLKAKSLGKSPKKLFLEQTKRDEIKKNYAKSNGSYLEINLVKIKTIKKAIEILDRKVESILIK